MARAAFYERERVIRVGDVEAEAPGPGQVQVKIAYAGICGTDLHIYHGRMDQRVAPSQIMGHEVSGTISALGEGVSGFEIGQAVTVMPLDPCHACPACEAGHSHICLNLNFLGIDTQGGFQTYWSVPADTVLPLPASISLKRAALVEPLAVACHDVRLGGVQKDEFVVVLGGGPIGTLVALVAQHEGAEVLVSEVNDERIRLGRELGLEVVNPQVVDLPALVTERTGGAGAAVLFEVTASRAGAATMTQLLRTRGRIVIVGIFAEPVDVDLKAILWREMEMRGARVYERQDFERAIDLAAADVLPLDALITEVYPLERLEAALQQLASGGAAMKILIDVAAEGVK
jgi:(R,R)-butanediol dehydrogenase / meso-butanediol dehydrogenase / diacetyl reductase